jgi:dipeptidyl aminopeptidase/acylaminoacyl peptidase
MKNIFIFSIPVLLFAAGCATSGRTPGYAERIIGIEGRRGNLIPAILTVPQDGVKKRFPAVLIAHGHGGSKTENGGFDELAKALAEQGLASLRMDFAGCGDNTEDFTQGNRLSFMLEDLKACKEFLKTLPEIDPSRLGILGYSMGGRAAAVAAGRDGDYRSVVLWSPAILPGAADLYVFMQLSGEADFEALYAEAKAGGAAAYTNIFGAPQTLGRGWFDDMMEINPLEEFAPFKGSLLLITGSEDTIIPAENARRITGAAALARDIQTREIHGADHGYGIYSGEKDLTGLTVKTSAEFFKKTL